MRCNVPVRGRVSNEPKQDPPVERIGAVCPRLPGAEAREITIDDWRLRKP